MRKVAPGVHVVEADQRFMGVEVGARMTVLELDGGLLLHSPVAADPAEIETVGEPRWLLAPNLLHHLHAGPWIEAGVEAWAAPGLPEKRPDLSFAGVVQEGEAPFGPDVALFPLRCFPMSNEVVLFHRPSRTLVVTDLLFNFPPTAPLATRVAMRCIGGYPGCRATLLERTLMRRDLARKELGALLALDFDRLIVAHGDIVESGAREVFARAYAWLGL